MNVEILSLERQGASHIKKNLICQDSAGSKRLHDGSIILALSDGHGSSPHFRSDRGSRIAVECALEALEEFASRFKESMLPGVGCTSLLQQGTLAEQPAPVSAEADEIFRHLGAAILYRWERRVYEDWLACSLSEAERKLIDPKDFESLKRDDRRAVMRVYGCTLQAAVRTSTYWFALHFGDGKIVAFRKDGSVYEPVPWDKDCFTNITTSLCEIEPRTMRYCYGVDLDEVSALFLASDGMDDSFGTPEELYSCYGIDFLGRVHAKGWDYLAQNVAKRLDNYSQYYSGDDMSIACWVDLDAIRGMMPRILNDKREICVKKINHYKSRLDILTRERDSLIKKRNDLNEQVNKNKSVKSVFADFYSKIKSWCEEHREEPSSFANTEEALLKDNKRNDEEIRHRTEELMRIDIEIKLREESLEKLQRALENAEKELRSVENYRNSLSD